MSRRDTRSLLSRPSTIITNLFLVDPLAAPLHAASGSKHIGCIIQAGASSTRSYWLAPELPRSCQTLRPFSGVLPNSCSNEPRLQSQRGIPRGIRIRDYAFELPAASVRLLALRFALPVCTGAVRETFVVRPHPFGDLQCPPSGVLRTHPMRSAPAA